MKGEINVELILEYMKKNGMSKTKFARECKIAVSSLNMVLDGSLNIGMKVILKIARYMKIEIKDMFIK